jgi:Ca2+/Na+ antiporter
MSTNQDSPLGKESQARIPPRFQFSLRTMFWVTTGTAIICAVSFPMPAVIAMPLMLLISVALPAVLTTVIIYGRSYQRTFCIGAMFPSCIFLLMIPYGSMGLFRFGLNGEDDFWLRLVVFGFWVFCVVVGLVCMGVRRLVEKRPDSRKP